MPVLSGEKWSIVLEQVGQEQEGPEHAGHGQQDRDERARPVPVAHHAQREKRVGALALPRTNTPRGTAATTSAAVASVAPHPLVPASPSPYTSATSPPQPRITPSTSRRMPGMPWHVGIDAQHAEEDQRGDRQVDVQAPAPVDVLGQEAAEDEPEGGPGDGDGGVNPEGPTPLRGSEKVEVRIDNTQEASSTPKRPCRPRAPISISVVCDAPPRAEAKRAKPVTPIISVRLGPNMSLMRPPRRRKPPKASVYTVTTPLPIRVGEPEGVLGRRQGDDHDRRVEHHHELHAGDDQEDQHVGPARCLVGQARADVLHHCSRARSRGVALGEDAVDLALAERPVGERRLRRAHAGEEQIEVPLPRFGRVRPCRLEHTPDRPHDQ